MNITDVGFENEKITDNFSLFKLNTRKSSILQQRLGKYFQLINDTKFTLKLFSFFFYNHSYLR